MHLLALLVDFGDDLLLIGNSGLFLLDKAVGDAFQLGSDRVQRIVVVLYPVFLLLNDRGFELVPLKP